MEWMSRLGGSLASAAKVVLVSKWHTAVPKVDASQEIVVLGNGPSLNDTITRNRHFLAGKSLLAVNFAGNAPVFFDLKPRYYVLADPVFFEDGTHDNVNNLWDTFVNRTTWEMTLFAPARFRKCRRLAEVAKNGKIKVCFYNLTPVEGFNWVENFAYGSGLGMPRPRNVLIPSLMLALRMGFKHIYVAGADHTWTQTLSVTDDNQVVSIQPHFYKEDKKEEARQAAVYHKFPLYKLMYSFYVAFKSYFTIRRYAESINAEIINITPGSFIDAFKRMKVSDNDGGNK